MVKMTIQQCCESVFGLADFNAVARDDHVAGQRIDAMVLGIELALDELRQLSSLVDHQSFSGGCLQRVLDELGLIREVFGRRGSNPASVLVLESKIHMNAALVHLSYLLTSVRGDPSEIEMSVALSEPRINFG